MNISIEHYYHALSKCDYDATTITLGYEFTYAEEVLSDKAFNIFLSDIITHEFLHGILVKKFSITVSKLFDAIGHLMENINIIEKVYKYMRVIEKGEYPKTWHNSIITEGFDAFLEEYHIDNTALNQAYIITRGK